MNLNYIFLFFILFYFWTGSSSAHGGWARPGWLLPASVRELFTHACYKHNVIKFVSAQCGWIILQSWRNSPGSRETETWWRTGRLVAFFLCFCFLSLHLCFWFSLLGFFLPVPCSVCVLLSYGLLFFSRLLCIIFVLASVFSFFFFVCSLPVFLWSSPVFLWFVFLGHPLVCVLSPPVPRWRDEDDWWGWCSSLCRSSLCMF